MKTPWNNVKMETLAGLACAGAVALLAAGCSDKSPDSAGARDPSTGFYRAQVLAFDGTAGDEATTSYRLKTVSFTTLNDFEQLDGAYIKMVKGGQLFIKDIEGSAVNSDHFEGGSSPHLRYRIKDGVVVARDYNTLLMLSAYYQFERMTAPYNESGRKELPLMEQVTGYSPEKFFAAMGRFSVMFEPRIRVESGGQTLDASIKLNAAFVPGQAQFILFQRSNLERVPLAANLQVIGHEFGHSVFERTFFENDFKRCDKSNDGSRTFPGRFSSEYAITGLNEGFADVVSWGFTGSTDILSSALDIGDRAKQRNFASASFTFSKLVADNKDVCAGRFYCIGTLFAKSVLEAARALGVKTANDSARREVTKDVVSAIAKVQASMKAQGAIILPDPSDAVKECDTPNTINLAYDGKVTGSFLAALVKNLPEAKRSAYCQAFARNFEESGFPDAARKVACP